MRPLLSRLKVVITAAPTWLALVAVAAPIVAEEAATVIPAPWSDRVTAIVLGVGAVAAAVVTTIRRLTPVAAAERGLLPR